MASIKLKNNGYIKFEMKNEGLDLEIFYSPALDDLEYFEEDYLYEDLEYDRGLYDLERLYPITVQLPETRTLNKKEFFLDIENFPELEDLLQQSNVAYPTGFEVKTQYYNFPVYKITDEAWDKC